MEKNEIEKSILAGANQLVRIFSHYKIDPRRYVWGDCWAGTGIWSLVLNKILEKKVYVIDSTFPYEILKECKVNNSLIFKQLNTEKDFLPRDITAVFMKSAGAERGILPLIENNPQIELVIVIPSGFSSDNSPSFQQIFREKSKNLLEYFSEYSVDLLNSEESLYGTTSQNISLNQDFPVIFARKRKV